MGKRRRKLLRRKYAKLPWNKYYENHPEEKNLSEQKINKVVEDNSVVLEHMKKVSSSCDKILQTIDAMEPSAAVVIDPYFMSTEPVPELEEPSQTPDLKKMLKKDLNRNINLGSGKPTTVKNLLKMITKKVENTSCQSLKGTKGDQFFVCSNNNLLKKIIKKNKFINLSKGLDNFISFLKK